jgi:hypothetical protein
MSRFDGPPLIAGRDTEGVELLLDATLDCGASERNPIGRNRLFR